LEHVDLKLSPIDYMPSSPLGAALRVVDLVKDYGRTTAVDHVSFEIRPGEFLAVLGPSGSGKTSVLMTIAGFEAPTAGEIFIGDRPVTRLRPSRRNLGVVFQSYTLFPHMTVRQNIGFPLRMRGFAKRDIDALVDEALALVQLGGYGGRLPAELSGGQQQRIAIARAVVFKPPVLLMDEPLGALDRRLREDMQVEIKRLHHQLGMTVVYVTHDQEEALSMADRIAVMRAGRLEQIGTPRQLYEAPVNAYVADFLGQMNFVDGTVAADGREPAIDLDIGCRIALSGYAGNVPSVRQRVRIGIRPENVRLYRGTDDATCLARGSVLAEVYVGGTQVVHIDLGMGTRIRARIPAERGAPSWQAGDAVAVSWLAAEAHVFPDTEDAVSPP
jgi:spermidine/putrescine ABC transporter ATP-binding subunit